MLPRTYKHPALDCIRWVVILVAWLGVTIWLWTFAWYWGALWLIPGFVLALNVVGFAMVPIYRVLNTRAAERDLLSELQTKRLDAD